MKHFILLILSYPFYQLSALAATDPFDKVVFVTNTTAWPYQTKDYGTKTFKRGDAASKNEDSLILQKIEQNGFHFPNNFSFGTAGSAYQYEGNRVKPSIHNPDGIGWSIWDVFSEKGSWLNLNGNNIEEKPPTSMYTFPNGSQAANGYDLQTAEEDLKLIKELGVSYYRLSISWPRLFPRPNMTEPDADGINYYKNILKIAKKSDLKILITLYHWDLPAWLYNFGDPSILNEQNKVFGWLDMNEAKNNIVLKEFQKYVASSYKEFGTFTPYISTFNEPLTFTNIALTEGSHAPGQNGFAYLQKKDPEIYGATREENLEKIPYLQAINIIKAHFIAYKTIHYLYESNPKKYNFLEPNVSIVLNSDWAEPYRIQKTGLNQFQYHPDDIRAAKLNMDFMLGWWLNPVMFGHWPESMNFIYSDRIKTVGLQTRHDSSCLQDNGVPVECNTKNQLKLGEYIASGGALDSLDLNHYTGYFVADLDYAKKHISFDARTGTIPHDQYNTDPNSMQKGWHTDQNNYTTQFRYFKLGDTGEAPKHNESIFVIGNSGNKPWLRQTWFAYRKLLQYVNYNYLQTNGKTKGNIPFSDLKIYLTENGTSVLNESQKNHDKLDDDNRVEFILGNLAAVHEAVTEDKINVQLFTYWSIVDNFEWAEGYDSRFGLLWVDYADNFKRLMKKSYHCFKDIIANFNTNSYPDTCRTN